jgi:hypothetical protein
MTPSLRSRPTYQKYPHKIIKKNILSSHLISGPQVQIILKIGSCSKIGLDMFLFRPDRFMQITNIMAIRILFLNEIP